MQEADNLPIYNSRIIKTYIEYLLLQYPRVAPDALLDHAGMSREEVEDPAHWFSQSQVSEAPWGSSMPRLRASKP